jgi:hypothetical protein
MNTQNTDGFGAVFASGVLIILALAGVFCFGYAIGNEKGKAAGEKNAAFIVVRSLHKVESAPENLFSDEDIKGLSYGAQNILQLAK